MKKQTRRITAMLLIFGFLFQPVLVYWASPWFDNNSSTGLTEVVCTLKGEALQELEIDSPLALILAEDEYCPAIQLVDMANTILVLDMPVFLSSTAYLTGLIDQTAQHQHQSLHYSAYSSRAPPVLS